MSEDIDIGKISEALNDKLDLDLGNATTTTKETIGSCGIPDYSKGISVSSPYTTTFPCYVTAEIQINGWESVILYADDVLVSKGVNHDSGSRPEFISGFVDAGIVIRNNKNGNMAIYPLKGV